MAEARGEVAQLQRRLGAAEAERAAAAGEAAALRREAEATRQQLRAAAEEAVRGRLAAERRLAAAREEAEQELASSRRVWEGSLGYPLPLTLRYRTFLLLVVVRTDIHAMPEIPEIVCILKPSSPKYKYLMPVICPRRYTCAQVHVEAGIISLYHVCSQFKIISRGTPIHP